MHAFTYRHGLVSQACDEDQAAHRGCGSLAAAHLSQPSPADPQWQNGGMPCLLSLTRSFCKLSHTPATMSKAGSSMRRHRKTLFAERRSYSKLSPSNNTNGLLLMKIMTTHPRSLHNSMLMCRSQGPLGLRKLESFHRSMPAVRAPKRPCIYKKTRGRSPDGIGDSRDWHGHKHKLVQSLLNRNSHLRDTSSFSSRVNIEGIVQAMSVRQKSTCARKNSAALCKERPKGLQAVVLGLLTCTICAQVLHQPPSRAKRRVFLRCLTWLTGRVAKDAVN